MFANGFLAITLAAAAVLAGCGGGGGHDAKAISEALVPDGPSGCVIQAEVDTGPDTAEFGGVCLATVAFHLFDRAGNELPVHQPLDIFPAEERVHLRQRICSGEVQPFDLTRVGITSTPSLFLVPDADTCPAGMTAPGDLGIEVPLASPLREVPCEDVGRVETHVYGCND